MLANSLGESTFSTYSEIFLSLVSIGHIPDVNLTFVYTKSFPDADNQMGKSLVRKL